MPYENDEILWELENELNKEKIFNIDCIDEE